VSIRVKLYAALAVTVAGLALTAGVGIWALVHLTDRFDSVQKTSDARALALALKFDVTDFNGWQTAYGYDNGRSRPIFIASVARFRATYARAQAALSRDEEIALLDRIGREVDEFMRVDAKAWTALKAGRTAEVKRLFLGPEIVNFKQAAATAERLAALEASYASHEEQRFQDAHDDALRLLIVAAVVASLLVALLLITALDLVRSAEGRLEQAPDSDPDSGR
jgi:hypothetical protein